MNPNEDTELTINYNHLRPPLECLHVKHKKPDIVKPTENQAIPFERKIFYGVIYEDKELDLLDQVEKVINFDEPKAPKWWHDGDTLRFIYEFDWDMNLICEVKIFSNFFFLFKGNFIFPLKKIFFENFNFFYRKLRLIFIGLNC